MSMKYRAVLIPPEQVENIWSVVREHLRPAIDLSGERWRQEYVYARLVTGQQQLWVVLNDIGLIFGAMTTEPIAYPERRALAIHFLGGVNFDGWYEEILKPVIEFAKRQKCTVLECLGRDGFWKWFEPSGFEKTAVFYELDLRHKEEPGDEPEADTEQD